jgi:hypothetical protein
VQSFLKGPARRSDLLSSLVRTPAISKSRGVVMPFILKCHRVARVNPTHTKCVGAGLRLRLFQTKALEKILNDQLSTNGK